MQESPERGGGQRLLRHLPAIYQEQPAVAAFLAAFESILFEDTPDQRSVTTIIEDVAALMDAEATPAPAWLASWVGLLMPGDLPGPIQRQLLQNAVPLYQRRGTKGGLQGLLDIVTGGNATVVEPETSGFRLGGAILGQTPIGRDRPFFFEVWIDDTGKEPDDIVRIERLVRAFTDRAKPAHTHYAVRTGSTQRGTAAQRR